jgi:hypothetical protein
VQVHVFVHEVKLQNKKGIATKAIPKKNFLFIKNAASYIPSARRFCVGKIVDGSDERYAHKKSVELLSLHWMS